jgi:hypothetical protein
MIVFERIIFHFILRIKLYSAANPRSAHDETAKQRPRACPLLLPGTQLLLLLLQSKIQNAFQLKYLSHCATLLRGPFAAPRNAINAHKSIWKQARMLPHDHDGYCQSGDQKKDVP